MGWVVLCYLFLVDASCRKSMTMKTNLEEDVQFEINSPVLLPLTLLNVRIF